MGKVFLSYRRADSQGSTGRLHDHLSAQLAGHEVFMDVVGIDPGEEFAVKLRATIAQCDVVLVVVGAQWASPENWRRLHAPDDHVRMEVAMALATTTTRVVPVFVDGATIPTATLPEPLRGLFGRNSTTLRHDGFRDDVSELVRALAPLLAEGDARRAAAARGEIIERDREDVRRARETTIDLSEHAVIHDMGTGDDCVAHSAACAIETSLRRKGMLPYADVADLIEQIRHHDRIETAGVGTFMTTPIYVIEQFGIRLTSRRPSWVAAANGDPEPPRGRVVVVRRVFGSCFRVEDYWRIPLELSRGRPVFACLQLHQSFLDARGGCVPAPVPGDPPLYGHAIVIVGWSKNGIRIANCQGAGWGLGGFGTMTHEVAQQLLYVELMWAMEADPRGDLAAELDAYARSNAKVDPAASNSGTKRSRRSQRGTR